MTYSVYQHWDPLKVCVVGRSYPPEFYSWIQNSRVRSLFEKIATETEEDYQFLIKTLEKFQVNVLRPDIPSRTFFNGKFVPPPMTPRDYTLMVGKTFYQTYKPVISDFYQKVKAPSWPGCCNYDEFLTLPTHIQQECLEVHQLAQHLDDYDQTCDISKECAYHKIHMHVLQQHNPVKTGVHRQLSGAFVTRLGKDLYFGTETLTQDIGSLTETISAEFTQTRNHIVNTGGHTDGTFCPVAPGLIISLCDAPAYTQTFPGWEVVFLPHQSWSRVKHFTDLKKKNQGRWWIPGFEKDQDVVDVVETWLKHWTGYVEETVFDVNLLIVDPKNIIVSNYNKQVFDALDRYSITPHIVPFRHRYFWDGGIHCITSDLHRDGQPQDYFLNR